jgi:hypothetical protein
MYYPLYCCTIHHTVTIATEWSHLHDLFNNSNDIGPIQQKRILLKIKQHAFLIISMYINNRMHASTSFIHAQYIFLLICTLYKDFKCIALFNSHTFLHDDYVKVLLTLSVQMSSSSFFLWRPCWSVFCFLLLFYSLFFCLFSFGHGSVCASICVLFFINAAVSSNFYVIKKTKKQTKEQRKQQKQIDLFSLR